MMGAALSAQSLYTHLHPTQAIHSITTTTTSLRRKKLNEQIILRLNLFRILLVLSLLTLGGISSSLSYLFIHEYEETLYESEFLTVVNEISTSVNQGILRKLQTQVQLSHLLGFHCPYLSSWPNCSLPSHVFDSFTLSLLSASDSRSFGVAPIVKLSQKSSFESFAYNLFETDKGFPINTGISSFGKGIYQKDSSGQRIPDLTGNTTYHSKYFNLFIPLLLCSNLPSNYPGIMFNAHSEILRGQALDLSLNCSSFYPGSNYIQKCSSITDVIQLISDQKPSPASVMLAPIFSLYDNLNKTVGFISLVFNWINLLQYDIPAHVRIFCILETNSVNHVFLISHEDVTYLGKDVASKYYNQMDRDKRITKTVVEETEILTITSYRLQFIPDVNFRHEYESNLPIIACVTCLIIVLFISITFILFDFLTKREAAKNVALLDSKRIFVRFISHEIRSPLNTITLGLEVLRDKVMSLQTLKYNDIDQTNVATSSSDNLQSTLSLLSKNNNNNYNQVTNNTHANNLSDTGDISSNIVPQQQQQQQLEQQFEQEEQKKHQLSPQDQQPNSIGNINSPENLFHECLDIIQELDDNSEAAVIVLNDLINYDKIELNTFTIEKKQVNIWKLINKMYHSLISQAKQKNIDFQCHIEKCSSKIVHTKSANHIILPLPNSSPHGSVNEQELMNSLYVLGDSIKLSQVIRNVISNALKLTPTSGKVTIDGKLYDDNFFNDNFIIILIINDCILIFELIPSVSP